MVRAGQFRPAADAIHARTRRFDGAQTFFQRLEFSGWNHGAAQESLARVENIPASTEESAGAGHRKF